MLAVVSEILSRWLRSEWGPSVIKAMLFLAIGLWTVSLRSENPPGRRSKVSTWIFGLVMVLIAALCVMMEYGYL